MEITYDILLEYKNITSFDIATFFQNALTFLNGDYQTIVNYFSGKSKSISSLPFNNFKTIKQQRDDAMSGFNSHKQKLGNLKWFLLLEKIEDIDSRLNTLDNINKWCRSSITKVAYDPSYQIGYIIKQNQTLENISSSVLGDANPEDDWVDIALANDLIEEAYNPEGGEYLTLQLNRANGYNFTINSVVDVIQGKSVYGKDLDKIFGFDGNNDLKVLGYDDTINQAALILIKLKKNDIKSSPDIGLQQSIVIGSNRALLNFPVITRQLTTTFAADDTFKNFTINKMAMDQDNLTVEWQVQSRLGEVINNDVSPTPL